jgi:hypothetical protein
MPVIPAKVTENRLLAGKSDVFLTDDDGLSDVPRASENVSSEACFLIKAETEGMGGRGQ